MWTVYAPRAYHSELMKSLQKVYSGRVLGYRENWLLCGVHVDIDGPVRCSFAATRHPCFESSDLSDIPFYEKPPSPRED